MSVERYMCRVMHPDFKRNIDFIRALQPHVGIDVIYEY